MFVKMSATHEIQGTASADENKFSSSHSVAPTPFSAKMKRKKKQ